MSAGLLLPSQAWACTACHSPLAREVRLMVLDNFWLDLAGVAACLPFLLAAVLALSYEQEARA